MFRSSPFDYDSYRYSGYPTRPVYVDPYYAQQQQRIREQQARELAQRRQASTQQRLRRAQYLPHEVYDEDDMDLDQYGDPYTSDSLSPWERLLLEKKRREEIVEDARQREAAALEEKRKELARQEEEYRIKEERRREAMRQQHREHLQAQRKTQSFPVHHINIEDGSLASPKPSFAGVTPQSTAHRPVTPSSTPTESGSDQPTRAPSPAELESRIEAANKIKTAYRIHSSLKTLRNLARQFETLKSGFSMPQSVDFQSSDGIHPISVPIQSFDQVDGDMDITDDEDTSVIPPKLAFTSANYHLHAYAESLNRLLIKLDGVESWGDTGVRKMRRRIVGNVEKEASRVEKIWKNAWRVYQHAGQLKGHGALADEIRTNIESDPALHPETDRSPVSQSIPIVVH